MELFNKIQEAYPRPGSKSPLFMQIADYVHIINVKCVR